MASNEIKWNSVTVDNEPHDLRLSFTMRNFLDYVCQPGEDLESPRMECSRGCGAKWTLRVFPYGQSQDKKDDICVFLKLSEIPLQAEIVKVTFKIHIHGVGENRLKVGGPWEAVAEKFRLGYGVAKLITRSELASEKAVYLPNGHFTVRCEGKVFFKKPTQILQVIQNPKQTYEEICSHIVFKSGSKEFRCNKTILAEKSGYFKAVFGYENRENVLDLSKDLMEDELNVMLNFVYLEKPEFPNLSLASIQNLFRVSANYEIDCLWKACETALIAQLDKDNANDLMIFAIEHDAERLKKAAATILAKEVV